MGENVVIHVLNKDSKGGAESLVNALTQKKNGKYAHKKMLIAESKFSIWLFQRKKLRLLPILFTAIHLFFLSTLAVLKRQKIFLIFHLAEGHVVAKLVDKMLYESKLITIVIYLHQSKQLFPAKIIPITESLIEKFPVVCYSKTATQGWFNKSINQNFQRFVVHNFVSEKFLTHDVSQLDVFTRSLNLVFVGRPVHWKRPDLAIEFAATLSKYTDVTISLIGLSRHDYLNLFDLPKEWERNLEIIFIQTSDFIEEYLTNSDLMIYLAESENSGESIGISALEALCLGTPVLIKDKSTTDFPSASGIYDLFDFKELQNEDFGVEKSTTSWRLINKSLKLTKNEVLSWRNLASLNRYDYQLENVLDSLKTGGESH